MHYVAVIDKDEGSSYGVRFPDVPGCFSAADTLDEIVPNAIEALALFFEDRETIPARGIEAVREEVAEDLAAGAVLMMIPHISDLRRVVRVNLSLNKGLLDTLDEAARVRGMTRSAFVAKAATREIRDPG
ncbi:MAG: ribbon-helix-helix protein, CopG family [Caldilineaceae bacterium SB0665_bin_21]|nr:ribbon-helix-helix protein, CopG family [Caldilineaceae bacterium SB0665_bin_21]MYA03381.1 ribbon-helix-helix protein, CopG family [Caldilineaceae bacterium SB0664_bin_22]